MLYYIFAFVCFFYMGYKLRGAVEIYKLIRHKKLIDKSIEEYFK